MLVKAFFELFTYCRQIDRGVCNTPPDQNSEKAFSFIKLVYLFTDVINLLGLELKIKRQAHQGCSKVFGLGQRSNIPQTLIKL